MVAFGNITALVYHQMLWAIYKEVIPPFTIGTFVNQRMKPLTKMHTSCLFYLGNSRTSISSDSFYAFCIKYWIFLI